MNEVEIWILTQPRHQAIRGFVDVQLIPSHMRDLESRGLGKMHNLSPKSAEALHTWRFLARVKEKLVAQADAEVGPIGTDPRLDQFP
jgi:hypothetical protein